MIDREAIRDLAHRYATAATGKDAKAMAELFDEEVQNGRWGHGREGTLAYFQEAFSSSPRREGYFFVTTHRIDLSGPEEATGTAFTRYLSKAPDDENWTDTGIVYFDRYRKRGDRWGFVRRRETVAVRLVVPGAPPLPQAVGSRHVPSTGEAWADWFGLPEVRDGTGR
jgi:uncharacterized protein (TIGR02246 family)